MEIDVTPTRGHEIPPCVGLTPAALPEARHNISVESSPTGVSTRSVLSDSPEPPAPEPEGQWYALRTTYGRERKAYDYLVAKGVKAFLPTIRNTKIENGRRKSVVESRLPNIFFAYGTEEQLKAFVYDNVNLPYLRFYYHHLHEGGRIRRIPLAVPASQIESLKIVCEAEANDIILTNERIEKFEVGQRVRVVDGIFKGVVGIVARYHGQQRVGLSIDGLMTIVTAYVPSAFIEGI